MSTTTPLLENTIEPDEPAVPQRHNGPDPREQVVLTPTTRNAGPQMATTLGDAESGTSLLCSSSAFVLIFSRDCGHIPAGWCGTTCIRGLTARN